MGRVQCTKHNMCGHGHRQIRQRLERREIGPFQLRPGRIDHREPEMGIGGRPSMPGNVLEDW